MKKPFILLIAFMLVSVITVPSVMANASSANQSCPPAVKGARTYALAGYIRAIDEQNMTLTVNVVVGNRLAKPCIGQDVVIYTTSGTIYRRSGGGAYSFDRLFVGQSISSRGSLVDGKFTARRITAGALLLKTR